MIKKSEEPILELGRNAFDDSFEDWEKANCLAGRRRFVQTGFETRNVRFSDTESSRKESVYENVMVVYLVRKRAADSYDDSDEPTRYFAIRGPDDGLYRIFEPAKTENN